MNTQVKKGGFLISFSIPSLSVDKSQLDKMAQNVGFPTDVLPSPPKPLGAWQRATNLGSAGIKISPDKALVKTFENKYGSKPVVRIKMVEVGNKAPLHIRHLVREVIVAGKGVQNRISQTTVAVMEFDTTNDTAKYTKYPDGDGWVNGEVQRIIDIIKDDVLVRIASVDANDIRTSIRTWLSDRHHVALRGTGGLYFIPNASLSTHNEVKAYADFVKGLEQFASSEAQFLPQTFVYQVTPDGDAFNMLGGIRQTAIDEIKRSLKEIAEIVAPVLGNEKKGKVGGNITRRAMKELIIVKANIQAYRTAFDENLELLDSALEAASETVNLAFNK